MRVEIATNSVDKFNGIKVAFTRFFDIEESEIEFHCQKVDSGVSEQPFNEETYQGALNRVNTLIENSEEADFYISCEAGIEEFVGQYLNVQVVCIFDQKNQAYFWGKSAGWQIPSNDIETIKKTNLDCYLRNKEITCIEELLGTNYSRAQFISEATELALQASKIRKHIQEK